jgi:hypothetical protein
MKQAHSIIDYTRQTGCVASAAANRLPRREQPCRALVEMPLTKSSRADPYSRQ